MEPIPVLMVLLLASSLSLTKEIVKPKLSELLEENGIKEAPGSAKGKRQIITTGFGGSPFSLPAQVTQGFPPSFPVAPVASVAPVAPVSVAIEPNPVVLRQEVPRFITRTITRDVQVPVPVPVRVPVDRPVPVVQRVPVEVTRHVPVYYERRVPYPVRVPVPYPVTVERHVPVDRPVYVERQVSVPVPVDRPVAVPQPVLVDRPVPVQQPQVFLDRRPPVGLPAFANTLGFPTGLGGVASQILRR